MRSIYHAMNKSEKLRLICLVLILFVYPVVGGNQYSQLRNPKNTGTGYRLPPTPTGQAYKVEAGQEQLRWAQGARRICL
jgi:hypothetical protein